MKLRLRTRLQIISVRIVTVFENNSNFFSFLQYFIVVKPQVWFCQSGSIHQLIFAKARPIL